MRKLLSIMAVLTTLVIFPVLGCGANIDGYDKVISEIRDGVYTCTLDGYVITATCGERERNYKIDGVANGREDFFILSVEGVFASAPTCSFTLEGKEYGGVMKKHPFNDAYSFEVCAKTQATEIPITVKCANDTIEAVVKTVKTENTKNAEYALSKAKSDLQKTIDKHLKNGVFDGEVYLRIIANPVENDGRYFWYVAFCKSESECYSVLLDCESGEVVARKTE